MPRSIVSNAARNAMTCCWRTDTSSLLTRRETPKCPARSVTRVLMVCSTAEMEKEVVFQFSSLIFIGKRVSREGGKSKSFLKFFSVIFFHFFLAHWGGFDYLLTMKTMKTPEEKLHEMGIALCEARAALRSVCAAAEIYGRSEFVKNLRDGLGVVLDEARAGLGKSEWKP